MITASEKIESQQRHLRALQDKLEQRGDALRRIANLLYGLAYQPDSPDAVKDAYAIAREAS